MGKTELKAEDIWKRHKVYTPNEFNKQLGDLGEMIELEPGVKIWSNLQGKEVHHEN